MQKGFLVVNKETPIANYLQHRSILDVVEEHRSLAEVNLDKINIVNCDKLLYIYYNSDDGDLAFRSDMNTLRVLTASAFFHVDEVMFIIVENKNPLLEDIVHSALRDSGITRDKIDIIHHSGTLMLADVAKYLSGSISGVETSSSYRDVYITEADKEEKERYANTSGGISDVLPVLTDMEAQYKQRRSVESISAGRVISESSERPEVVAEFSRIAQSDNSAIEIFVVSGDEWSDSEKAVTYITDYLRSNGRRSLVINLDTSLNFREVLPICTELNLLEIKSAVTPANQVAVVNARYNQFGYVVHFLRNILGVEKYIVYCSPDDYRDVYSLTQQLAEVHHAVYVSHYNSKSVKHYLDAGLKATALFLNFNHLYREFQLQDFKDQLAGTIVAQFPLEDVDTSQFYNFAVGGTNDEQ